MTWRNYTKTRKVIKPTNCTDTAVDRFGLLIWLKWKGNWKQQDLGKTMNYCHASLDTQEHARHAKTCITLHHSNAQYPGGTQFATCKDQERLMYSSTCTMYSTFFSFTCSSCDHASSTFFRAFWRQREKPTCCCLGDAAAGPHRKLRTKTENTLTFSPKK